MYFEQVGVEVALDSEGWDFFTLWLSFPYLLEYQINWERDRGSFEEKDCEMGNVEHIKQRRCQMCCLGFIRKWIMKYF